jgi:hypothetical protein
MSFVCCYCKNEFEGTNNFEIPEGFPRDKRLEGLPLCDGCGGGPEPTLDTICGMLDEELAAQEQEGGARHWYHAPPEKSAEPVNEEQMSEMADNTVAFIDYLKSLPSDDARSDVMDMIYEKVCKECGRLLGDDEKCFCDPMFDE